MALVVLKMFTNEDEVLEQERNLEKMSELATAYFDEDDTQRFRMTKTRQKLHKKICEIV